MRGVSFSKISFSFHFLWCALLLFFQGNHHICVYGANFNAPHPHRGISEPFRPGPPNYKLKNKDQSDLREGKCVQEQITIGKGGRGLVIQDVHAPPEVVWSRILDFPGYTKMVPKVTICENYSVSKEMPDPKEKFSLCKNIFTRMRLTVIGFHMEYFIHHKYYPSLNTVVWTLDYDKESDLEESVGYWHVIDHPDEDRPHWSRVYYSIDMKTKGYMPSFVKKYVTNKALTEATAWVKRESEKIGVPKHLLNSDSKNSKGKGGMFGGFGTNLKSLTAKQFDIPSATAVGIENDNVEKAKSLTKGSLLNRIFKRQ